MLTLVPVVASRPSTVLLDFTPVSRARGQISHQVQGTKPGKRARPAAASKTGTTATPAAAAQQQAPHCAHLAAPEGTHPMMGGGKHVGAPVPEDDWQRVEALRRLELLDTPEEESFTAITTACSQIFQVCQTDTFA